MLIIDNNNAENLDTVFMSDLHNNYKYGRHSRHMRYMFGRVLSIFSFGTFIFQKNVNVLLYYSSIISAIYFSEEHKCTFVLLLYNQCT